ncbi:MAG: hypothetical protein NC898_04875 [Candidatus Omnitrophica bacterium]|nr:hypothetical protein [Candidatus Omnitrophota bacterium]MCM8793780.1 hypothetical protein [Candidatus Omnitrophota bacterium]
MLNDFELEKIERQYFDLILLHLKQDLGALINGLNSRIKILNDWYDNFIKTARKGYKASDLDSGAERIFHHFFASILRFPNSSPLGSDLMFELPDAFMHIEIKTALLNNPADYKGKINIAINQTSYVVDKIFTPNLPQYYRTSLRIEKPCLTYIVQIVHEHAKPNIKALKLVCIPNGQLYSHYGKGIFKSGKGGYAKGRDFRYHYSNGPYFKLLSKRYNEKIFRVELIYLAKGLDKKDITNLSDIPVHFQF